MLFPPRIRWDITMSCNLACKHCQVGKRLRHRTHPSRIDICKILSRFSSINVSHIGILGGEPLAVPYINDVLNDLNNKLIPYTVSTNGQYLNQNILDSFSQSARAGVMVSIDGPDQASHDDIRGKGTFQRATKNIRILAESLDNQTVSIGMACTLNAKNMNRVPEFIALARDLGMKMIQFSKIRAEGNTLRNMWLLPSDDAFRKSLFEYFSDGGREGKFDNFNIVFDCIDEPLKHKLRAECALDYPHTPHTCPAATASAALDHEGRLWPCTVLSYTNDQKILDYFGLTDNSLLECSIEEIWRSPGFERIRLLNKSKIALSNNSDCEKCRHVNRCTPCPLPYIVFPIQNRI